jgi:hypothetical protein
MARNRLHGDHAEIGFDKTVLQFATLTGERHGEILGSMWSDVDFDKKEISVRRNWSGIYREDEPIFTTPKTKHSFRVIPIPDELCLALKKWKLQCPTSKWDLVFPKSDGQPQDRKATWRALDKSNQAGKCKGNQRREALTPYDSLAASLVREHPLSQWNTDPGSECTSGSQQREHHHAGLCALPPEDADQFSVTARCIDLQSIQGRGERRRGLRNGVKVSNPVLWHHSAITAPFRPWRGHFLDT